MKTPLLFVRKAKRKALCVFLVCAALLTSSCGHVPTVTTTDAGFYHPGTGVSYVFCDPLTIRPFSPLYIYERYGKDEDYYYYTIQHEDPQRFLAEVPIGATESSRSNNEIYPVYRAAHISPITMENFSPIYAEIFREGLTRVQVDVFYAEEEYRDGEPAIRDDSEYVYAVRDAINNGERVTSGAIDGDALYIYLGSALYPGLAYIIVFYTDTSGISYLRDRTNDITVIAPKNITSRFMD